MLRLGCLRAPNPDTSPAVLRVVRARAEKAPAPRGSPASKTSDDSRRDPAACIRRARSVRQNRKCRVAGSTEEGLASSRGRCRWTTSPPQAALSWGRLSDSLASVQVDSGYGCTINPRAVPEREKGGWLLLIHQIPPKPNYFRVKIWRRLQRLGAVGIKNSVYALPATEQAHEDLNWVLHEIVEGGGDASLVEARFVEGLSDEQVKEMFRAARDADYQEIANEARELARKLPRKNDFSDQRRAELEGELARLQKRVGEVAAVDFFLGRAREPLEGLLVELAERLAPSAKVEKTSEPEARPRGRTWVTRTGIHVDRMASAWR